MYLSLVSSVRNLSAMLDPPTNSNAASPPTDKQLLLSEATFFLNFTGID